MALFKLEIFTPDRQFFCEEVEAVSVECPDGGLTVLAGHAPMVAAMTVGTLKIKQNGSWKEAFHSEGFLEVRPDETLIFSQACEWPQEIDLARAQRTQERLEAKEPSPDDDAMYRRHAISLARAAERIRLAQRGMQK